ncbi:MAG TPA: ATP-binding protein [Candidatus Dormibacteraeota bacterium]|nr:ATP-binding protein [Candidatus Dormibacteraeota bacterium]
MASTQPNEAGLARRVRWYVAIRWFFVASIAVPSVLARYISQGLSQDVINVFTSGLIAAIYNVFFWLLTKRLNQRAVWLKALSIFQLAADTLLITFLVFEFGGVESRSPILFAIPILITGVLFGRFAIYLVAIISALLYNGVLLAEITGLIQSPVINNAALHSNMPYTFSSMVFFASTFLVIAAIADFMTALLKENEAVTEEQAEFLRNAEKIARVGSWEWEVVTAEVDWSDELYEIYGVDRQTYRPGIRSLLDLVHPDDVERVDAAIRKSAEKAFSLEYRIVRPDGQIRVVHSEGRATTNPRGNLSVIGTSQDITERIKAEQEALRRAEQLEMLNATLEDTKKAVLSALEDLKKEKALAEEERAKDEAILASIGDGVFAIDTNRKIILFNQAAADITGYQSKQVMGENYHKVFMFQTEKEGQPSYEFVENALKGRPVNTEAHLLLATKGGLLVPIAYSAAPIKDTGGKTLGAIVVIKDITVERGLEQAKDDFLNLAAHQLRTPASGVKAYSYMLRDGYAGKLTPKQLEFLKQLNDSNERQLKIINDMLSVARIQSGKFEPVLASCNTSKLIQDIVEEQKQAIAGRRQKVTMRLATNLPEINIDPDKIRMVIENLVSNASKYTPDGGQINIDGRLKGDYFEISVADTGVGIPKKDMSSLFQRFGRLDNPLSTKAGGTGLGLYIAKTIIDMHHGEITVKSEVGKGSVFTISLPIGLQEAKHKG